ncbi:MAG: TonB-dependent receptor [Alphaproteobacteria bacterium]|nr:TonB-dependent receptor [Alphaproteobacteria bacterium]
MTEKRSPDVVVIGQRPNLLRIPGSGATIEADQLERSRVFTVNEALRSIPGAFPRDEEGMGMRPNIGFRGMNPTRSSKVLLLEDGIPLAFAPYGDNATYFHPPVERYTRIEVLKGASQVRFGPHTVGGVVNYITPKAPDKFGGQATIAAGNRDYFEIDATAGGPFLGGRALAHAQIKESDGARDNTRIRMNDIALKVEWDIADDQALTARVSRYSEDSKITYSGLTRSEFLANPYGNPFANDRFEAERFGGALSHAWFIDDATTLKTTLYGSYFTRDWWRQSSNSGQRPNDATDPACAGMANLNTGCGNEGRLRDYVAAGVESRLAFEHTFFGLPARTETGLRYHFEDQHRRQWNGDTPFARQPGAGPNAGVKENNDRNIFATSGFLTTEIDLGGILIEPGVRFEHIEFERKNRLSGAEGETDLDVVIPGLGLVYELTEKAVIYAGVHKGFSPPRVEDIISNVDGATVDLAEEESVNWELGIRGDVVKGLYGDFTYFRMDFSNQIIPASAAGGSTSILTSAGETLHEGLELLLRGSLRDAGVFTQDDVYMRAAATYVATAEFEGRRFSTVPGFNCAGIVPPVEGPTCDLISGNRLPYAPEWLLSAAVGYEWKDRASFEVEAQYSGGMFTDDRETVDVSPDGQRGRIKSSLIWNATLNVEIPDTPLTAYVSVKNVFDEVYVVDQTRGQLPGAPRLIQAGVSVKF